VEDAFDIVEGVESRMNELQSVVKGIDKRMSYNLRLMGTIILDAHSNDKKLPKIKDFTKTTNSEPVDQAS